MISAEVRITTVLRHDNKRVDELKKIEGVKNVHMVYGTDDILVEIEGKDRKALDNILFLQIRKLKGIRSTSPLVISKE
ncbi:Lrp/AsnC ligand binding domain-containing protein [Candidatus Bathyarchaeota archaeon]|nr:Lrp/AsnC ligand binding domain-containing protein [Candidatus Bathyarchaeota archaeon]